MKTSNNYLPLEDSQVDKICRAAEANYRRMLNNSHINMNAEKERVGSMVRDMDRILYR